MRVEREACRKCRVISGFWVDMAKLRLGVGNVR
jgi:hypothetical protein